MLIKLCVLLAGVGMVGAALLALAMLWPFMLIVYGLVIGWFLIQFATNI